MSLRSVFPRLLPCLLLLAPAWACKRGAAESGGGDGSAGSSPGASSTAAANAGTFASGFEGAITMHVVGPRAPANDLTFLTKNGMLRIDMPVRGGQVTHSLFDPRTRKVTVIMDSQKMALERLAPVAPAGASPAATISRTGKHETVAGYDCEDWDIVSGNGNHSSSCVAKGIAFFDFAAMAGPGNGARSWADELRDNDEFPLRTVELDRSGKELSRMEVTTIEKKPLDDSLFVIPPGYDSSGIRGGMGAAGGMPSMPPHPTHR